MTSDEVRALCREPGTHCNPPAPRADAGVPAKTHVARVLQARHVDATSSEVTIAIGSDGGVTTAWTGEVFDGVRRIGKFTPARVERRSSIGRADVSADRLHGRVTVRLSAP